MTAPATEKPDPAALLARLDELRHAERRAASTRMVSVTGHLIGTPLNIIAGRAALIRSNPSPEAVESNLRRIEEQVERLSVRVRRLIDYFGLPEPSAARRSVGDVLAECSAVYRPIAALKGVSLDISAQGVEALRIEASLSALVLTTLLSLGIRRASPGQSVRLDAGEQGQSAITFELGIPGLDMPPSNFDWLEPPEQGVDPDAFEALSLCLGLARRAGGSLSVTRSPAGDLTVCFECPRG
ncbi:MAG: HAMP domain-containing sensor histidine kinase [Myxococcales bacterium]